MKRKGYWRIGALAAAMVIGAIGFEWFKAKENESLSAVPKSIVTTFAGDPHTSRAFTWYTATPVGKAVIQLAEGAGISGFNGKDVISISGRSQTVDTGNGSLQESHRVTVMGLQPGKVYSYRVGSGEEGGWSQPAQFETESAEDAAFTFLNVTDTQGESAADLGLWGRTLAKAFTLFPDARFVVHNGDLTEDPENETGWDFFFSSAERWLKQYPFMPVAGNHDEVGKNAERFASHFTVPGNGAPGATEGTTYSFDYGEAHFVVMNTESNMKKQIDWLREDAAAAADKRWLIVAIHRPAYGGNRSEKTEDWVTLFDELGVDLVLQGHNHEYSRSYPLKGGKIVPDGEGTVYVTTNAAGQKFNEKKADRFYHRVHFQNNKPMFAAIRVSGEELTYEAYDVGGRRLDAFTLKA